MANVLVLVRHGESEWNKLNLFTGWRDPDLTETGIKEAHLAGKHIKKEGFVLDIAFTSALPTGEPYVRRLNADGSVASKATLTA